MSRIVAAILVLGSLGAAVADSAGPEVSSLHAGAVELQEPATLVPPRVGLLPVEVPQIESLEKDAREHLLSFHRYLSGVIENSKTTETELGQAYGLMGQVYHAYSLAAPAESCYLNAIRLEPEEFRWIYLLGNLYHENSRLAEALLYYREARRLNPRYSAVQVQMGNLLLQLNRLEEARQMFTEVLAADPDNNAAIYGLGQAALSSRDFGEAVSRFERVLAQMPEANRVNYSLAMAYRGLGEIEKATTHLQRSGPVGVRAADPLVDGLKELTRGERVHLIRGRLAFDAGRFKEAVDEFSKALAANPASVPARVNLGTALAQLGDSDAAIREFQEVLKENPQNAGAHYNLGFLFAKLSRHDQAIHHLRSALDLDPKDTESETMLSRELAKIGRIDEAANHLSHVVQSDPGREDPLLMLVQLLIRKNDFGDAIVHLEKAHSRFPVWGRTAHALAYILAACPKHELRDGARALDLAQRVYNSTRSIEHGTTVALALAELGRCAEAAEWQKRMIDEALKAGQKDLANRLKANLNRFEQTPCRPSGNPAMLETPGRDNNQVP